MVHAPCSRQYAAEDRLVTAAGRFLNSTRRGSCFWTKGEPYFFPHWPSAPAATPPGGAWYFRHRGAQFPLSKIDHDRRQASCLGEPPKCCQRRPDTYRNRK